MLNTELIRGSRRSGYDCNFCNLVFGDRGTALDHAILAHDIDKTACIVICHDCDFERHFVKDCETSGFAESSDARQEASRSKAGHMSHNPHHRTKVINNPDGIPE